MFYFDSSVLIEFFCQDITEFNTLFSLYFFTSLFNTFTAHFSMQLYLTFPYSHISLFCRFISQISIYFCHTFLYCHTPLIIYIPRFPIFFIPQFSMHLYLTFLYFYSLFFIHIRLTFLYIYTSLFNTFYT